MSDKIITLSDDKFEADVINAEGPVLVDFGLNGAAHVK